MEELGESMTTAKWRRKSKHHTTATVGTSDRCWIFKPLLGLYWPLHISHEIQAERESLVLC